MSLYEIGLTALGIVSVSFIVGSIVILLFQKQLIAVYGPTPPLWMWKTVGAMVVIGVISFIMSLIGLAVEE